MVRRASKRLPFLAYALADYESDECLIWPFGKNSEGYGVVTIDNKTVYVHRHLCIERHGPPPSPDHIAAHSCGRGHDGCCNYRHLRWATRTENEADKWEHGTQGHKLSLADVLDIRRLAPTTPRPVLARQFGVTTATIKHVVLRKTWSKAAA